MTFVLLPGERSTPRNLDAILVEYRRELNEDLAKAREAAEAASAPLEGFDPLPTESNPDLAKISLVLRHVDRRTYLKTMTALEVLEADDGDGAEKLDRLLSQTSLVEEFVAQAVAEVRGLVDTNGSPVVVAASGSEPLDVQALAILDAAGLTAHVFTAAKRFQLLTGEKKRLCGAPPPTTP